LVRQTRKVVGDDALPLTPAKAPAVLVALAATLDIKWWQKYRLSLTPTRFNAPPDSLGGTRRLTFRVSTA
jgi:hypothetical protein